MKAETKVGLITGLSFWQILGLIFIVLKLCNIINWSWWLVLLPIYGTILFSLVCLIIVTITMVICVYFNAKSKVY